MKKKGSPLLMLSSEANNRPHHDLYHCLADEFHKAVGVLLDEVLKRHGIKRRTRREIVSFFLFSLMNRLDAGKQLTLPDKCFDNYPKLATDEPEARKPWQPALAFLRREMDGGDWPLDVQKVLVCTESWLHEVCGEWEEDYFAKKKG